MRLHSPRTLSKPRSRKWRYPARHLRVPKGCSARARGGALAHRPQPCARDELDHVLMHPTLDFAPPRLGGEALGAQRTGITVRLAADIAQMPFATGVALAARRRPQQASHRTAVNIARGVVGERLMGEAALAVVVLGLWHIGRDRVRLARLECLAVVIADIGQRRQCRCAERLFGGQRHRMQCRYHCRR